MSRVPAPGRRVAPRTLAAGLACALLLGCAHRPASPPPDYLGALRLPAVGPLRHAPAALRGRVVLISFFATWCFPCLGELPVLSFLQRTYAEKGLTVLLVGMDLEGAAVLRPFAEEYDLPFPVLVADERLREGRGPFGQVTVLPSSVILDRQGSPVAVWQGLAEPAQLVKAIERALGP